MTIMGKTHFTYFKSSRHKILSRNYNVCEHEATQMLMMVYYVRGVTVKSCYKDRLSISTSCFPFAGSLHCSTEGACPRENG